MYLLLANFESAIIAYVSICTTVSTIRITNWLINFDDYAINGYSNFCIETIKTKIEKAYGTRSSQTVPHSSTILARRCLTSVIGRERVYSSWCGRRRFLLVLFYFWMEGTSAYAGPHYQKLYGRVIHVWNNRKCQLNRSAMEEPQFGRRPLVIRRTSPSGKYADLGPCRSFTGRQGELAYGAR